jgi:hypothetical protein
MPFDPASSQNTKLYWRTAPTVFALIDGITTLTGSGGERTTIPATAISDSESRSLPGMPSDRTFEGTVNYVPADVVHAALRAACKAGTKGTFKKVDSDGQTDFFDATVVAFGMPSYSANQPRTCAFKLLLDGDFRAAE